MTVRDLLLIQMDHAWAGTCEALENISTEFAGWQSEIYRDEPRRKNWPLPGTIGWHVVHLQLCKEEYRQVIINRPRNVAEPEPLSIEDFGKQLSALHQAHDALRATVASLTDAELSDSIANGQVLHEFISMAMRHDTWHASQITLAKRLWRAGKNTRVG